MMVYLAPTGKTVTCTVSLDGGVPESLTVTDEGDGRHAAEFSGDAGWLTVLWENTTDAKEHRELRYWDGEGFVSPIQAQAVRDSMGLAHTDGSPSVDVFLKNIEGLTLGA